MSKLKSVNTTPNPKGAISVVTKNLPFNLSRNEPTPQLLNLITLLIRLKFMRYNFPLRFKGTEVKINAQVKEI